MAKASVYISADNMAKLPKADGLSGQIGRAIDRLHLIMTAEQRAMACTFTGGEWSAMRNACKGTHWEPATHCRDGVLHNIQDSLNIELESYGVNRANLEGKLTGLSMGQQVALVDMIERWWADK